MTKDKRNGWLANIKAGDKVWICYKHRRTVAVVTGITPSGIIKTEHRSFQPNGNMVRASAMNPWNVAYLAKYSDDVSDAGQG